MLSKEILELAERIKSEDLYPPVTKVDYSPDDVLLPDCTANAKDRKSTRLNSSHL